MLDAHNSETWVIGVDVGGTKVAAGFVDRQGEILHHTRTAMNRAGSAAEGLAAVTSAIDALLKMAPESRGTAERIGICAPGPLEPRTGGVLSSPNMPCWRHVPLAVESSVRFAGFSESVIEAIDVALTAVLWVTG